MNRPTYNVLFTAMEFGYKACEQGMNLEEATAKFERTLEDTRR